MFTLIHTYITTRNQFSINYFHPLQNSNDIIGYWSWNAKRWLFWNLILDNLLHLKEFWRSHLLGSVIFISILVQHVSQSEVSKFGHYERPFPAFLALRVLLEDIGPLTQCKIKSTFPENLISETKQSQNDLYYGQL